MVAPVRALANGDGSPLLSGQNIIEHYGNAPDPEAEDQAFQVEARLLRKIKETRRIPIPRNENRFGQAKRNCQGACPKHHPAVNREKEKNEQPRHQDGARPDEPDIMIAKHYLLRLSDRLPRPTMRTCCRAGPIASIERDSCLLTVQRMKGPGLASNAQLSGDRHGEPRSADADRPFGTTRTALR